MLEITIETRVKTLVSCGRIPANSFGIITDIDNFDARCMYEVTFDSEEDSFGRASDDLSYWESSTQETKNWIEIVGEKQ